MSDLILEKDGANFSPGTQKYFTKIIAASQRMQRLIIALLDYSRYKVSDADFVVTDLNRVVEEAMEDLQQRIDETGATIKLSKLPALNVIPFQFVQLFSNLLGNALKYKRLDVPPLIDISASKIGVGELILPPGPRKSHYWEIKIRDNGIGFDQQQVDRMFGLFQRLPSRSDIEGTGIGLPICLKIAQNHGGHISAEGQVGIGSTFKVYIPFD
jgi:light-regulated signal transduction histidine kinase (bacteriophytochrome)